MVDVNQEIMLNDMGWTVVCYSPFEIEHTDGSFARGQAAFMAVPEILEEWKEYQLELKERASKELTFGDGNLKRLYELTKIDGYDKQLADCKNSVDFCILKMHYVTLQNYEKAAECRDYEKKAIEKELSIKHKIIENDG